jgi:tRNA-splicing ligase RtcB
MEKINDKLLNWASILEDNTRRQAEATSRLPFVFPHVALMPDAHLGKGATVGSVIPTERAIIPAAVGVDIGCGMIAVRSQWTWTEWQIVTGPNQAPLREAIERAIPLSAGRYNERLINSADAKARELDRTEGIETAEKIAPSWPRQLGTLGSGNHFIEITVDEADRVWLFLHSGSRGVGNKMAQKHIKTAQELCKRWHIRLEDPDLAYLVEGTDEFWAYIRDLRWAQKFALLNREEMMDRLVKCVEEFTQVPVIREQTINCHHNYTEQEKHFGRPVWLSRKGAIDASEGTWGLIPGSMGAASYVVQGKGNRVALNSSPHGAGRVFSRGVAKRTFTLEDLADRMKGIEWRESKAFLDEHPDAYKNIDVVMADAADLVEVKHELHQVLNVKGD